MARTASNGNVKTMTEAQLKTAERTYYLLYVMFQIAFIVLFSYFLFYFHKLKKEDCKCALGWRSKTLQVVLAGIVVMLIVNMFYKGKYAKWLRYIDLVLVLVFIVVGFQFSSETRKTQCQCALTPAFRILDIVNMVMLVTLIANLIVYLVTLVMAYAYANK